MVKMAKLKRVFDCSYCKKLVWGQDEYIKHLEIHVLDLAKKLDIVIQ